MRLRLAAFAALASLLLIPGAAFGAGDEFDPSEEFALDPWISIELGPIDMSINKAVFYLFLATVICLAMGLVIRGGLTMRPNRAQNVVEMAYEFTENQIARPTLSEKVYSRYFPYVATLFLFILVSNLISFIPLPVSHTSWIGPIPDLSLYAATANINVTLALTLVTFVVYNYEGVKAHGVGGYLKTMVPEAPRAIQPVIFVIEILSQILRLVSLSVRLFANLLAGHLLIIMAAGFMVLLGNFAGLLAIPVGVFFWVFEWLLVAGLQAFIFAMLSGIYIGFAVESSH